MRTCLGSILLIILVAAIALTAFYHWETNARIEFSARDEGDPTLDKSNQPIEEVVPKKNDPYSLIGKDVMQMNEPPAAEPVEDGTVNEPAAVAEQPA